MIDLTSTVTIDPYTAFGRTPSSSQIHYNPPLPHNAVRLTYDSVRIVTREWAVWDAVYFQVMWGHSEVWD